MKNKYRIEKKARTLWGGDLHKDKNVAAHCYQLRDIFQKKWTTSLKGKLLEIGCGSGSDLNIFSKVQSIKKIVAIDLGSNIVKLARKYQTKKNIIVKKGNALSLKFKDNEFDIIYSFGVFHHTADPKKCISESYRVLKKKWMSFFIPI